MLKLFPPFDVPLSMSELARLPRRPVLLLRWLCPLALRISLFLRIIGVSANGRAILVALSRVFSTRSPSSGGTRTILSSSSPDPLLSAPRLLRLTGLSVSDESLFLSPESRADRRLFGAAPSSDGP